MLLWLRVFERRAPTLEFHPDQHRNAGQRCRYDRNVDNETEVYDEQNVEILHFSKQFRVDCFLGAFWETAAFRVFRGCHLSHGSCPSRSAGYAPSL